MTGLPAGAAAIPLRIRRRRFWLGAGALGLIGIVAVAGSPPWHFIDFPQFWSAGRTAGTPALFDPDLRRSWGQAHDLGLASWVYPPGSAWLFVPFGIWPIEIGFWLHATAMTLLVRRCRNSRTCPRTVNRFSSLVGGWCVC